MKSLIKFLIVCTSLLTTKVFGAVPEDEVKSPLFADSTFKFKWYSGYLDASVNKSLHYIYLDSQSNPDTDPLLVWFNGGPGSSSLLGFIQEHGPWIVEDDDNKLQDNKYSWNAKANVLYLESPAGVGYSINNQDNNFTFNDIIQSQDALQAMNQFFVKYPERRTNKLFITGESYAGIYVPYLAYQLYLQNEEFDRTNQTQLKTNLIGIVVGNGATDWDVDVWASGFETYANFNILPLSLHNDLLKHGCKMYFNDVRPDEGDDACHGDNGLISTAAQLGELVGFYDLNRENPNLNSDTGSLKTKKKQKMMFDKPLKDVTSNFIQDLFNNETIKQLMHTDKFKGNWSLTNDQINSNWKYQQEGSIWIYRFFKNTNLKMLFFSGTTDGSVVTLGSRRWIKKLNQKVVEEWRPWVADGQKQISGFIERYEKLDFVTIHKVGHMAPQWARIECQYLINQWMNDLDLAKLKPKNSKKLI